MGLSTQDRPRPERPVMDLRIALIGGGEIARRHLAVFSVVPDTRVTHLVEPGVDRAARLAAEWGIDRIATGLDEVLSDPDVDAVVVATPTPLHPQQASRVLAADKHLLLEIPMGETIVEAEAVAAADNGRVSLVAHSRRFGPNHRWLAERLHDGRLRLQHLEARVDFFRRTNSNAAGEPRDWADNLLWHHATHTIDLLRAQAGEITQVTALAGPRHPALDTTMDMGIVMRAESEALCTLTMSFNSDSPQRSAYRYICDGGTYVAADDRLWDGHGREIDLTGVLASDGTPAATAVEAQDREFAMAIREGRPSALPLTEALETMRAVHRVEQAIG